MPPKKKESPPSFKEFFAGTTVKEVDPVSLTETMKILLFGHPGSGKTSLAASASKVAELSPVLFIDLEQGSLPALEHGDLDNMTIVQASSFKEFKVIIDQILNAEEIPFKTIVIDTVDRLQHYIVRHWGDAASGFEKWAQSFDQVFDAVDALAQDIGVNVIAITHETREIIEDRGYLTVGPTFQGKKSSRSLPSVFDIIGRVSRQWSDELEKNIIVLSTEGDEDYIIKRRFSNIPENLGNPNFEKIYKYVLEYIEDNINTKEKENEEE